MEGECVLNLVRLAHSNCISDNLHRCIMLNRNFNYRIAVCISGGKDSMLMAKCLQELKLHNKFDFEVKFVVMDPGYSPENRKVIEDNAKSLHIPITIFETDIFDSVYHVENSPC